MIVRLTAEGTVVQDPDDLAGVQLHTDLDAEALRTALAGTGELLDGGAALLDLSVLRSLAVLTPTSPGWPQRWAEMVEAAERDGRLSPDRRAIRVPVQPVI